MVPPPSGGGTSTISARLQTAWHVLKVEGYTQIKGMLGIGKRIESGTFDIGGYTWRIGCYPDGLEDEMAEWICVDLALLNPATAGDVKVCFKFSLLDHVGEPVLAYTKASSICTFSRKRYAMGFDQFIKKTDLESSYIYDDSFKIKCDVTVLGDICTEIVNTESEAVPPPDLHCHLGALLDSQVGADVTFNVSGVQFMAHRIVLSARSPVFMAQLFGPMMERFVSHVQIDDIEARVFKVFLHFIYTDSLPEIEEGDRVFMAQHLLVAADRYNMGRLKLICADMLRKHVDTSLVATTLVLAEQHGCDGLKEACFKFLISPGNLTAAMASEGFRHLKCSCPSLLEELLAKIAP